MKKLHPLLSVLFLISTGFGQNEQSMYDNLFFTKSKHWKVKDFYYTSTKENSYFTDRKSWCRKNQP